MNREELLEHLCPTKNIDLCCSGATKIDCIDCKNVMNTYLGEYDKHVISQYEAEHGNLTDMIRDIHDCVAREMYCKGVDDFVKSCDKHCGFYSGENKNLTREDILFISRELKEQK